MLVVLEYKDYLCIDDLMDVFQGRVIITRMCVGLAWTSDEL